MAAFVVPSGSTLADQNSPPLIGINIAEDGTCTIHPTGAIQNFYHTLSPPTAAEHHASQLQSIAFPTFTTSVPATAHESPAFRDRMAYIHCTKDRAIPLPLQQHCVARAGIGKVATLETDHSPFLSMPGRTAEVVVRMARGFDKVG